MSITKQSSYERKKHKSNLLAKKTGRSHRCIVARSNMYTYGTIVDGVGNIILHLSDKGLQGSTKKERSHALGLEIARRIKEKGLISLSFDRNGYLYHGRVESLCKGMREGGIVI